MFTFNLPAASRSPSGAHADELEGHAIGILPGHEGGGLVLASNSDDAIVGPTDPEATEFTGAQDGGGVNLDHIGLGAVFPDHRLGILPASQEYFDHGIGLRWAGGQRQMSVMLGTDLEANDSSGDGVELVLQLVLCAEL